VAHMPNLHGQRHRPVHPEGDDETAAETSHGSGYTVQLGPYPTHKKAVATRMQLGYRGYSASLSGRTLRLGSFSSRKRAERLAARLRLSGSHATIVALPQSHGKAARTRAAGSPARRGARARG